MLETIFKSLVAQYTSETALAESFWEEIETQYNMKVRFFHRLTHLENLLQELLVVKDQIQDWYSLLFTLYYHDIIYAVLQQNNEEKSAELATIRLMEIHYPPKKIETVQQQIIATKLHQLSDIHDTNLFNDADLSILGKSTVIYSNYITQIREEYKVYPYIIYKKGREQVLYHFLKMPRIYKTDHFFELYETQARKNIAMELKLLSR
jgi:predicted metal-dependent HD superfamily phosphohydrolase